MKTKMTPWTQLAVCSLASIAAVATAQADDINSFKNGNLHDATTWGADDGFGDGTGPVPGDGDTAFVSHRLVVDSDVAFEANLVIESDRLSVVGETLTMGANITLNGSDAFLIRGGGINLGGNIMTMNDGKFNSQAGDNSITNGDLAGSGTILLATNSGNIGQLVIADTVDTTGFMGAFDLTGGGLKLAAISSANASFGLIISDDGVYANAADVAFSSLTIAGGAVTAATYTRTELLQYGFDNYGGADWSDFIGGDDTYEITVVPEPGTYALIGGLLALASVMIRRRR
ncbi:MAG: PEP-CTERM sorting domain-containing protein [Puniceicoccaceae bacterium]|nr:PEP-CTERM sorting domain-containing protein [Puniceicoccaceae bacterium]